MNKILIFAAAAALSAIASPVFAEDSGAFSPTTFYGNLGGTVYHLDVGVASANAVCIGGRLGARFGKYLGVEGEVGVGVNNATFAPGVSAKVDSAYGAYAVGFLPVAPNADLFARVGYGRTHMTVNIPGGSASGSDDAVNYGGGGQYFFDAKDGVRVDYTRVHSTTNGNTNTFSLAYVRKF